MVRRIVRSKWTPIFIGLGFVISLIWLILTFVPVMVVEAKYQYRSFITAALGTTSLRALFIPDFTGIDLKGNSKHREYGITIPAIYIDEPVVFNVDPNDKDAYSAALKKGIVHASATSFPDGGGLGYYFAHSSLPDLRTQYNAVFYLLGKLQTGDQIYIWHEGKKHEYLVNETTITAPEDLSFLYNTDYPTETIVLQTCWPPGTTQKRLLVFASKAE